MHPHTMRVMESSRARVSDRSRVMSALACSPNTAGTWAGCDAQHEWWWRGRAWDTQHAGVFGYTSMSACGHQAMPPFVWTLARLPWAVHLQNEPLAWPAGNPQVGNNNKPTGTAA